MNISTELMMDALSPLEKQRLAEILATARAGNWSRFIFLTDQPFANARSMKEQFEDSSRLINALRSEPRPDTVVKNLDGGSRLIFAKITLDDPVENPILITLHSTSALADAEISIWTFFQEVSLG
jgi:hypothetical protein